MLSFNPGTNYIKLVQNKILIDFYLKLKNDTEYIPLFNINKNFLNFYNLHNLRGSVYETYYPNISKQPTKNYYYLIKYNNLTLSTMKNIYNCKDIYKKYINSNNVDFNYYVTTNIVNYENLFNQFLNNDVLNLLNLRSTKYLSNFGYLADYNNFNSLLSIMIKKEHLKYFKLCYLTNTPINYSLIELWIDESLLKDIKYKNLKIAFNKFLKPKLLENNIKVVTINNLNNYLFNFIELPTFKTISDKKVFESDLLNNYINDTNINLYLNNSNLILED